jgi:mRNA interferase RelE/StbE
MSQRLLIPNEVANLVRNLHPSTKKKVRAALQAIIGASACGKPLKDELAGLRSFRVGRFRTIYRMANDRLVEVVAIGPRRCIYEETYRKLQGKDR